MLFSPGDRLKQYEILGLLGEGGMGEVYRARDTELGRDVAIKASHARFGERFQREARLIGSLNHPNICTLYEAGPNYIVMELVEGPTLAERIKSGPIPLDQALEFARQIGEALEAAHEKSVIHRDLKPANIKIREDGLVKVLDFGLAKGLGGLNDGSGESQDPRSKTLTIQMTAMGAIMGTPAYMSPEQARGEKVDKRTDIWAFGVVLFEMLTAQQLFTGRTPTDVLAAVVTRDVKLEGVPPKARRLVELCLEKDPKRRLRDIGEAWRQLEEPPPQARPKQRDWLWPGLAAAGLGIAAAALAWVYLRPAPLPPVTRFEIHAPAGSKLPLGTPAISPDGRTFAYTVTGADGVTRIYTRPLDSLEARLVPGTEKSTHPFFSPDGHSLGFIADNRLKWVDLGGGEPHALADTNGPWHGSWGPDGTILFVTPGNISRIPASGGTATAAILKIDQKLGESSLGAPQFLTDGKRFLLRLNSGDDRGSIQLGTLGSQERKMVLDDVFSAPLLAPTPGGLTYLLYLQDTTLMARRFDEASGAVMGDPIPLAQRIGRLANPAVIPALGVSPGGTLAYQIRAAVGVGRLSWFDRSGKLLSELPAGAAGDEPVLSPDGRASAVVRPDPTSGANHVWVTDLIRGASSLLTFGQTSSSSPVWSSDGKRLAYLGTGGIFEKDASGAGEERSLVAGQTPQGYSPDGQYLLFKQQRQLALLPLKGDKKLIPVGSSNGSSENGAFSPDGKYLAFASDESGRQEVYVQLLPPAVGRWQVSLNGGVQPLWRRDGKELFFLSSERRVMAVDVKPGTEFTAGVPHQLFAMPVAATRSQRNYDVSADGQRFLIYAPPADNGDTPITVVLNWWAELKK